MKRFPSPHKTALALAAVAVLALCGGVQAAAVPWDTPSGSSPGSVFSYSGGNSGDGSLPAGDDLWGDPSVYDWGFHFGDMESTFKAEAAHPNSTTVLSTMQVMVVPTAPLTDLWVLESGEFLGDIGDVDATWGSVSIFSPMTGQVYLGPLSFSFDDQAGEWSASAHFDMTAFVPPPTPWIQLQVTNHLEASPDTISETAWINKTEADVIIPEPGTLLFGAFGLVLVTLRRSRNGSRLA